MGELWVLQLGQGFRASRASELRSRVGRALLHYKLPGKCGVGDAPPTSVHRSSVKSYQGEAQRASRT